VERAVQVHRSISLAGDMKKPPGVQEVGAAGSPVALGNDDGAAHTPDGATDRPTVRRESRDLVERRRQRDRSARHGSTATARRHGWVRICSSRAIRRES
jgi:hypothetical protein